MKTIKWIVGLGGFGVLVLAVLFWYRYAELHPATDDAYLQAHVIDVSPQVTGRVEQVLVDSFQPVKQGQLMLKIDDSDYSLALQQAEAELALSRDQLQSATAQLVSAQAKADAGEQLAKNAHAENRRLQTLFKTGMTSKESADNARYKKQQLDAEVKSAHAAVEAAQAQLAVANAQLKAAKIRRDQAQLDLSRTQLRAPADGVTGEVKIQAGSFVGTGAVLFPLVKSDELWVAANFKETDLKHLVIGQPASVALDMYPDRSLHGEVAAISPASGESFSLLPAQNATGNWVKVTQRFPVRIRLKDFKPEDLLRLGASATVTVDATQDAGNVRS